MSPRGRTVGVGDINSWMDTYLEQDSIRGWNGFKHVTCDETQVVAVTGEGGLADELGKVQHGALDARERLGDHTGAGAVATADVDEGAHPAEDAALVNNNDLKKEFAVGGHGVSH